MDAGGCSQQIAEERWTSGEALVPRGAVLLDFAVFTGQSKRACSASAVGVLRLGRIKFSVGWAKHGYL